MGTRRSVLTLAAAMVAGAAVASGCTVGSAPPTPTPMATASPNLVRGTGFTIEAPSGYVDVTERAVTRLRSLPLFADGSLTPIWVGVDSSSPGNLDHAFVVAVLAGGADPATEAGALAKLGGAAAPQARTVAGQTWYAIGAGLGNSPSASVPSLAALCRFAQANIVLVEGGAGVDPDAHPRLWAAASTLARG